MTVFLIFFFFHTYVFCVFFFFFSSRRRHTRLVSDWSSDVCSSDLEMQDSSDFKFLVWAASPVSDSCYIPPMSLAGCSDSSTGFLETPSRDTRSVPRDSSCAPTIDGALRGRETSHHESARRQTGRHLRA